MLKTDTKYKFTNDYQWDLLRYTVQDKKGEKALNKYDDDYFTLTEHQIIAHALKLYYNKERKIPGETILREKIIGLLGSKEYVNLVTKDEQKEIISLITPLYKVPVRDGDEIYKMCKDFASYIKVRNVLDNIDIADHTKYDQFLNQFQNAIADQDEREEIRSSFLLADIKERQFNRLENKTVFPTPFRQINELTNAYGYEAASILVILDKQKKGKTFTLANIARGYLKMKKKILVVDFENGKDNIFSRLEQGIMRLTKEELLSGKHDNKVQKRFRKYARLGGEIVVLRLPALVTTANDIQKHLDSLYRDFGFRPEILILDYLAKMGDISGTDDERKRISNAYLDVGNLALLNGIEHVWTANHVTRKGAEERQATKYKGEDIALCIDITRHAQAIFGLNRSTLEEDEGIFRMEVVEQRDGKPYGRAIFNTDFGIQRADEFGKLERTIYDKEIYPTVMGNNDDEPVELNKRKRRKNDLE